jgi:hypothetical protein
MTSDDHKVFLIDEMILVMINYDDNAKILICFCSYSTHQCGVSKGTGMVSQC